MRSVKKILNDECSMMNAAMGLQLTIHHSPFNIEEAWD